MALLSKKIVTFNDLQYLIDEEGFLLKNTFTPSNKACTVGEVLNSLHIAIYTGLEINNVATNRLCRREIIVKRPVEWVGTDPSCIQDSTPVDTYFTAPVLVIGAVTTSTIALSWSGATDNIGIAGYHVYVSYLDPVFGWVNYFQPIDVGLNTTHTLQSLQDDTLYRIGIKVINLSGDEKYSNYEQTTTDEIEVENVLPTIPVVSSMVISDNSIQIGWTESVDSDGYIMEYNAVIYYWDNVYDTWRHRETIETDNNTFSATFSLLASDTTYRFTVSAIDNSGGGVVSSPIELTTTFPSSVHPPTFLRVVSGTEENQIWVEFSGASADNAISHYELYIDSGSGFSHYSTVVAAEDHFVIGNTTYPADTAEFSYYIKTVDEYDTKSRPSDIQVYPKVFYEEDFNVYPYLSFCNSVYFYLDGRDNDTIPSSHYTYNWYNGSISERIRVRFRRTNSTLSLTRYRNGIEEIIPFTIIIDNCA